MKKINETEFMNLPDKNQIILFWKNKGKDYVEDLCMIHKDKNCVVFLESEEESKTLEMKSICEMIKNNECIVYDKTDTDNQTYLTIMITDTTIKELGFFKTKYEAAEFLELKVKSEVSDCLEIVESYICDRDKCIFSITYENPYLNNPPIIEDKFFILPNLIKAKNQKKN